jgi:hypothetical protein
MNMRYDDFMADPAKVSANAPQGGKVELMRPSIHVQLQVRKVVAADYNDAAVKAMYEMISDSKLNAVLEHILGKPDIGWPSFADKLRVAKEADGTYTVTLP